MSAATSLSSSYVPIKELGHGDSATVTLGQDKLNKFWAYKKYHRDMPKSFPEEFAHVWEAQFEESGLSKKALSEQRLGFLFKHHVFVKMGDLFIEEGLTILQMEYIEAGGVLEAQTGLVAALDLVQGLQEAYELGYIHADLYSANILIEKATGRLRLIDLESFTETKTFLEMESDDPNPLMFLFKRILGTVSGLYRDLAESDKAQLTALLEAAIEKEEVFKEWGIILSNFTLAKAPGIKV